MARVLAEIRKEAVSPVYLIWGDRYLCREVADDVVAQLLPDEKERRLSLRRIDGEQEDVAQTMHHLQTYSLFAGRQVIRVMDSQLFYSKAVAKTFWDKAKKAESEAKPEKAGRYLLKMIQAGGLERDESLTDLSGTQWKKLFGFDKPDDVAWCAGLVSQAGPVDEKSAAGDALVMQVLEKGVPKGNVLILVTEAVDKRKKLYKLIGDIGVIIDLSVDSGATSMAQKGRDGVIRDLVLRTLAELGKKPGPGVVDTLIDRVGFHPVAAVREAEKVALFAGETEVVSREDVNAVVGQTREEAIYELNDAVASANLDRSLKLLARLHDGGLHPLALVAGLRNLLRKLLFFKALTQRHDPLYQPALSFPAFQQGYLPELKKKSHGNSPFLAGHPFVLYKTFQQAGHFSLPTLREALGQLLEAEFQLKSSGLPPRLILERFLFAFLG
ncbi:MAG: DNA polymerase III subunit delta [Deltaproteobacteria bacterium]|nr:DNA polymerase III subunit delta [Deltaproteobacteria bacterium]